MKASEVEQSIGSYGIYGKYVDMARDKGAACGRYVATLKTGHDDDERTVQRAAVGFVNRLPLDDLDFEKRLRVEFELAAMKALKPSEDSQEPVAIDAGNVRTLTFSCYSIARDFAEFAYRHNAGNVVAVEAIIRTDSAEVIALYDATFRAPAEDGGAR